VRDWRMNGWDGAHRYIASFSSRRRVEKWVRVFCVILPMPLPPTP